MHNGVGSNSHSALSYQAYMHIHTKKKCCMSLGPYAYVNKFDT